jgi:hypothetical protein
MRSLDFACPDDVEGLGMIRGRARSSSLRSQRLYYGGVGPSEPELNIRGLTARSYKTAFHITILPPPTPENKKLPLFGVLV